MSVLGKVIAKVSGLAQQESARAAAEKTVTPGMPEILREAAAQGAVLLKNDGVLPLARGTTVSLFGRGQSDWFYTGYGSGGDVNKPYAVSLLEGLEQNEDIEVNGELRDIYKKWGAANPIDHGYWGHWPRFYPDMPLNEEMVKKAAEASDCAIITIGRSSGEDRENALEKGSFYLTDGEREMLKLVCRHFDKTVVLLNIGSIMDMSWIQDMGDSLSAVLILWQGGMESGNAAADILSGKAYPGGRLTDTVAKKYEDYPSAENFGGKKFNNYTEDIYVGYRWFETFAPDRVLYPFGFGLGYTDFSIEVTGALRKDTGYFFEFTVKNIGSRPGREVVQLYIKKPCDDLGNPARSLAAFEKTPEIPAGGECTITLFVPHSALASYDDSGKTGYKSAYVTLQGEYEFYAGKNVRDAELIHTRNQKKTSLYKQLSQAAAPKESFEIVKAADTSEGYRRDKAFAEKTAVDLRERIKNSLPEGTKRTGDRGYKLSQVKEGKITIEDFVAQLDTDELEAITRGDYTMNSSLGVKGNAGVMGGVLESLRQKGVPPVTTTDGPSGIRLLSSCSLIPIGTLLASTFDPELVSRIYKAVGGEMREKGSDVLLAPGMNIHRNPLCGRNFEYFSEDPLVSGKIAAAAVKGLQSTGVGACPKHFACNNQEYKRNSSDSRVSERALREIYLKGFEICVREASPRCIMTSYNRLNGVFSHYHYDLCTVILREEWGFKGCVMTDWWMQYEKSPEFPHVFGNGYRVRAQVDVLMPGGKRIGKKKPDGTLLKTYGREDGLTLGEIQRSAINVLKLAMASPAFETFTASDKAEE